MQASTWEELAAAALLGTGRQPAVLPEDGSAAATLLAGLRDAPPEAALLGAAAVLSISRSAGRLADVAESAGHEPTTDSAGSRIPGPAPCASRDAPLCRTRAAERLRAMLHGEGAVLLPEWLEAVGPRRERVPPELVPALLERGRRSKELRPLVSAVIGARGRWIVSQQPQWDYAADSRDEADWHTASRDRRKQILQKLRETSPADARALLSATWKQESADDRAAFLSLLTTGLSAEDEPFLESALDDRAKSVRAAAAELLPSLPESAFATRMKGRAAASVRMQKTLLHRELTVVLPDAWDPSWARDGLEEKPPYVSQEVGQRGWWVVQIIAATPLTFWEEHHGVVPGQLSKRLTGKEWRSVLIEGFALAAMRQHNAAWGEALVAVRKGNSRREQLLGLLPPARLEAVLLGELREGENKGKAIEDAFGLLDRIPRPWSEALGRELVQQVRARVADPNSRQRVYWIEYRLQNIAISLPRTLLAEALQGWPPPEAVPEGWQRSLETFWRILQDRLEMYQEIEE